MRLTHFLPAFTEQNDLIKALWNNDKEEYISSLRKGIRSTAKRILDQVFEDENVNIIAAPADSPLCIHAAASGEFVPGVAKTQG